MDCRSSSPHHLMKDLEFSPMAVPVINPKFSTFKNKRSSAFDKFSSGLQSPPSTGIPETNDSFKPGESKMFLSHFGSLSSLGSNASRIQSPTSDAMGQTMKINGPKSLVYQKHRNSQQMRPLSSGSEFKTDKMTSTVSTRPFTSGTSKF